MVWFIRKGTTLLVNEEGGRFELREGLNGRERIKKEQQNDFFSTCQEIKRCGILSNRYGWIAQLVEQRTENPRVAGSIPAPATTSFL